MNHFQERRQFQPFPVPANAVAPTVAPTVATTPDDVTTLVPAQRDMPQAAATDDVTHVASARDVSPDIAAEPQDTPRQSDDAAHNDRERFTLTVENVAVRLADENIYRDPRTIQRWCQSGKLDCLLDIETGEKYLIEPTSLERMVATLTRDRDRQARAMSRQHPDTPRPLPRQEETASDNDATHAATKQDVSRPTPDDSRDAVAQQTPTQEGGSADLQTRIQQLETELAMTKADKQVREQMVDYLKEQFEQMLDGALDRSEQIGELRAENTQLKNLLDAGPSPQVDNAASDRRAGHVE